MFEDIQLSMRKNECAYPTFSSMYPIQPNDMMVGHYVEPSTVRYWDECDTEAKYDDNGGHPHYSKTDIVYSMNRHGYRSPEFDSPREGKFVLVVIGCSNTKGVGLPQHETYVDQLARKIENKIQKPVLAFNCGQGGTANDKIALRAFSAAKFLKPDYLVVQWTHTNRSVYVSAENLIYDWWNFYEGELDRATGINAHIRQKARYFEDVQTMWNDSHRVLTTVRATGLALSKNKNFGYLQHMMFRGLSTTGAERHFDLSYTVPHAVTPTSIKARDHDHIGYPAHKEVAETLMKKFETWWDTKNT